MRIFPPQMPVWDAGGYYMITVPAADRDERVEFDRYCDRHLLTETESDGQVTLRYRLRMVERVLGEEGKRNDGIWHGRMKESWAPK